jgi:FMN phosphatase YigB (HAD superfamily)
MVIKAVAFDFGHMLIEERNRGGASPVVERAGIGRFFAWVVTSVDAGFRKPAPEFFDFALAKCALSKDEVLFVGNQLSTNIRVASNTDPHCLATRTPLPQC